MVRATSATEEDEEEVFSDSNSSNSSDEYTVDHQEEEDENDDDNGESNAYHPPSDEDLKSKNVDALLRYFSFPKSIPNPKKTKSLNGQRCFSWINLRCFL